MIVRRKHIRDLAFKLLAEAKTSRPPVPIEQIAGSKGVTIRKGKVEPEVSGFLYRNAAGGSAVIGVNKAQHPNRQRFTIAHELGHLLLHAGDAVHVDSVKHRDLRSEKGTDIEEIESNLFAAELLMPVHFLQGDLQRFGTLDLLDEQRVENLAQRYLVSNQAMAVRLSSLGYLAT
jgi:Zn-dependent peptidase ImmA (M78 family)